MALLITAEEREQCEEINVDKLRTEAAEESNEEESNEEDSNAEESDVEDLKIEDSKNEETNDENSEAESVPIQIDPVATVNKNISSKENGDRSLPATSCGRKRFKPKKFDD